MFIQAVAIDDAFLLTPDEKHFVQQHLQSDIHQMLLRPHLNVRQKMVLQQVARRQKIKQKLPEHYANPDIFFPSQIALEQSSSAQTARYKGSLFSGDLLVDLTAGMGIDTFYVGQNFKRTIAIEKQEELAAITAHNLAVKGLTNAEVVYRTDAEAFLSSFTSKADLIYIDPARRDQAGAKVFQLSDCEPDIVQLLPLLNRATNNILLKTSPLLDITAACQALQQVCNVYVVSCDGECKELLFHLKNCPQERYPIHAIDLDKGYQFSFDPQSERQCIINFSRAQKYLYEPAAALLKAGAFKSITAQYPVSKLHQHTHLYTSSAIVSDFPGRTFLIEAVIKPSRAAIHQVLPGAKANLSIRNFPGQVVDLKKKWGLSDGGEYFLFACTVPDEQKVVLVCKKV